MRIISVNVGRPREFTWRGEVVTTAIFKEPVSGPTAVRRHQLEGDGQADPAVHGGPNKAIYAYALQHYAYWTQTLPDVSLQRGNFGENLTVDDFDEKEIRVGDEFTAGTATLMATQPRLPCYKLALRFGREDMVDLFLASRRTGVYFAVLEEGVVQAGDAMRRIRTHPSSITIAEAARLYVDSPADSPLLRKAIASPGLPDSWRQRFERNLHRLAPAREAS